MKLNDHAELSKNAVKGLFAHISYVYNQNVVELRCYKGRKDKVAPLSFISECLTNQEQLDLYIFKDHYLPVGLNYTPPLSEDDRVRNYIPGMRERALYLPRLMDLYYKTIGGYASWNQ